MTIHLHCLPADLFSVKTSRFVQNICVDVCVNFRRLCSWVLADDILMYILFSTFGYNYKQIFLIKNWRKLIFCSKNDDYCFRHFFFKFCYKDMKMYQFCIQIKAILFLKQQVSKLVKSHILSVAVNSKYILFW